MNENDALQTYHTRYNNTTYRAVQTAIVTELHGELIAAQPLLLDEALASEPTHMILNLVIDTALELVQHPLMTGRGKKLIAVMLTNKLSANAVETVAAHLANFDTTAAADWKHTALALQRIDALNLAAIKSHTSAIHGAEGNAADHLISAAANLLHLARLTLLNEPSVS
ncbi:MAG: hypothetical protein AAFU54_21465 [Chloroflexota bacterium]